MTYTKRTALEITNNITRCNDIIIDANDYSVAMKSIDHRLKLFDELHEANIRDCNVRTVEAVEADLRAHDDSLAEFIHHVAMRDTFYNTASCEINAMKKIRELINARQQLKCEFINTKKFLATDEEAEKIL